jgi:hypothetical protein
MLKNTYRLVGQVNVNFDKIQILTNDNNSKWFSWKNAQILHNCSYGRWFITRPLFQKSTFLISHDSIDISQFNLNNQFLNNLRVLSRFELNNKTLIKDAYFELDPSDKFFNTTKGVYEVLGVYKPNNWVTTNSRPQKWFVLSVLEDIEPQLFLYRS